MSETGLDDLPQTKDDLSDILNTVKMLGIDQKNQFVLVDTDSYHIELEFERLKESIYPETMHLEKNTGIGGVDYCLGLAWPILKILAFDLIEKGEIKVSYEDDIPKVDLLDLDYIEVSSHIFSNYIQIKLGEKDQ